MKRILLDSPTRGENALQSSCELKSPLQPFSGALFSSVVFAAYVMFNSLNFEAGYGLSQSLADFTTTDIQGRNIGIVAESVETLPRILDAGGLRPGPIVSAQSSGRRWTSGLRPLPSSSAPLSEQPPVSQDTGHDLRLRGVEAERPAPPAADTWSPQFVRGAASELEVVDTMFNRPEVTHLHREPAGRLLETTDYSEPSEERNGRVSPFSRPTASTSAVYAAASGAGQCRGLTRRRTESRACTRGKGSPG